MNQNESELIVLNSDEVAIVVKFDDTDWACLHDAVMDSTGKELNRKELEVLFNELPRSIQFTAFQWGMSDTVFGDEVYVHLQPKEDAVEPDNDGGREPMLRIVTGKKGVGKSRLKEFSPEDNKQKFSDTEFKTITDAINILRKLRWDICLKTNFES